MKLKLGANAGADKEAEEIAKEALRDDDHPGEELDLSKLVESVEEEVVEKAASGSVFDEYEEAEDPLEAVLVAMRSQMGSMTAALDTSHKQVKSLKKEVEVLKNIVEVGFKDLTSMMKASKPSKQTKSAASKMADDLKEEVSTKDTQVAAILNKVVEKKMAAKEEKKQEDEKVVSTGPEEFVKDYLRKLDKKKRVSRAWFDTKGSAIGLTGPECRAMFSKYGTVKGTSAVWISPGVKGE